jgi:hypothetical protein
MPEASSGAENELSLPMAALIGVRVVAGTALLVAPGRVLGDLPHQEIKGAARAFARILGARHLVEAAVLMRDPSHRWALLGAGVDGLHAATMFGLAATRPDERRLALTNAVTASALAVAGVTVGRHEERR